MVAVKSVKIDGEMIYIFKSAVYIYQSSTGYTLQLDLIVSEVVLKKYKNIENLILEIELEDGRILNSIMTLKILSGGLPQLNLYCELDGIDDYEDFELVHENDPCFPQIQDGITIEDIRKVEMPQEEIRLKLTLPIDQVEWLNSQKKGTLNEMFEGIIFDLLKNRKEAREA
jgi:hypothetical protein